VGGKRCDARPKFLKGNQINQLLGRGGVGRDRRPSSPSFSLRLHYVPLHPNGAIPLVASLTAKLNPVKAFSVPGGQTVILVIIIEISFIQSSQGSETGRCGFSSQRYHSNIN
jgi:hypothetical protein